MSLLNTDAVDLIEENLNSRRTNEICHKLDSGVDSMWCVSLRKCSINDKYVFLLLCEHIILYSLN